MTITTNIASLAAFAAAIVGCGGSTSDDDSTATKTMTNDWSGESVTILFDGVPSLAGPPILEVVVDPEATRVTAIAAFAAGEHAKLADVSKGFGFTEYPDRGGINVTCKYSPQGGAPENSGCTSLRVTIPPGTRLHPHAIYVLAETGSVRFAESGPPPNVTFIDCAVPRGEAVVNVSPVPGAGRVAVKADADVEIGLPGSVVIRRVDFAENEGTRIVTDDFPGMQSGRPWPDPPPADVGQPSLNGLSAQRTGSADGGTAGGTVTVRKVRTGP